MLRIVGRIEGDHVLFEPPRLGAVRGELGAGPEHPALARHLLGGVAERRKQNLVEPVDGIKAGNTLGQRLAGGADEDTDSAGAERVGRTPGRDRLRSGRWGDQRIGARRRRYPAEGCAGGGNQRVIERHGRQGIGEQRIEMTGQRLA